MSAPTRQDGTVAALSEVVGGPTGSRAGVHPWWTPTRVTLLLATLTLLAGLVPGVDQPLLRLAALAACLIAGSWVLALIDLRARPDRLMPGWGAAAFAASPLLLVWWQDITVVPTRWWSGEVGDGSVWLLVQEVFGLAPTATSRLMVAVGVVVLALVAAYGTWERDKPRDPVTWARCGAIVVGALLLVAPVVSPLAALLLLPWAALGVRRWGHLLLWQACELVSALLLWWSAKGWTEPIDGGNNEAVAVAIVIRVVGVAWIIGAAIAAARSTDRDLVEVCGGEADPH